MRRFATCPLLISLALLSASPLAFGRDVGPSGDVGDCRDSVITVPSPAQVQHSPTKRPPAVAHKAKPAAATPTHTVGGGGDDEGGGIPRVPRWHSFLPGMFR
jgi:hypothetical protein